MTDSLSLDLTKAHQFFAADCFNKTWAILDQPSRSARDDEQMLLLSHASLWHWTQREDCTDQTLSVGYWLISRVFAVLQRGDDASRYAERCLAVSHSQPSFYLGYAHEALARAARLQWDSDKTCHHLSEARRLAALVTDSDERAMLEKDLDTIQ